MVLITGGLGYIGSHLAVELLNQNYEVILLDDLSRSQPSVLDAIEALTHKTPVFYKGCISDTNLLKKIITNHSITHVIHLAGYKSVKEGEKNFELYFTNNVTRSTILFEFLIENNIKNIIFSSSATVYEPTNEPLTESSPTNPITVYGQTKLFCEQILKKLSLDNPDLNVTILRYFNPIEEHPSGLLKDTGIDNLYPAIKNSKIIQIYGNDYPTPDGTPIRDFIPISRLVDYHIQFLNSKSYQIYNIGTGIGTSVLDLVKKYNVPYEFKPRRPGDAPILVCSINKLKGIQ